MTAPLLVRFYRPTVGAHLGYVVDGRIYDLYPYYIYVYKWLRSTVGRVPVALEYFADVPRRAAHSYPLDEFLNPPTPETPHLLPPVDQQEIWAAGVTYERSRAARQEEAKDGGDVYARVYEAPRPELFFKSLGIKTVGHLDAVGIRADATWNVPEPELGLVFNPALELVGFTIGNDMSSRDIEGENPLYLPQAKVYKRACSLGPGILLAHTDQWLDSNIQVTIERKGKAAFEGEVHTDKIRRSITELADYLGRSQEFPDGVVLLTGTGTVPPADFTLKEGDVVKITIGELGTLENPVQVV